ncbi:MAG TPA: hypothetical protein VEU30_03660 [Thermoanaerobaculia bacterium]|nr:hypothetical protein [Thermoanaerobaculia bacterium]
MKASAAFLLIALAAGSAAAQEATSKPDYSRQAVQRFVMSIETEGEEDIPRHRYDPLVVNVAAFGTTFRIGYLPQLMMPLAGSQLGVTQTWPDAFSLTNTSIATSPRAWRTTRTFRRELNDINRRIDATVKVNAK